MFLLSTFTLVFLTGHLLVHAHPVSLASSASSFSSGVSPSHVPTEGSHRRSEGVRVHRRGRPSVTHRVFLPQGPDVSETPVRARRGAVAPQHNLTLPHARLAALPSVFWPTSSAPTSPPVRSDASQVSQASGHDVAMEDVPPLNKQTTEVTMVEAAAGQDDSHKTAEDPMQEEEVRTRFHTGLEALSQDPTTELMSSWLDASIVESALKEEATPFDLFGNNDPVSDGDLSKNEEAFHSCQSSTSGISAFRRAMKRRPTLSEYSLHPLPTRSSRGLSRSSEAPSFGTALSLLPDPDASYEADAED